MKDKELEMTVLESQAYDDREQIKVLPVRNGILVKSKHGWFVFTTATDACNHVHKLLGGK